MKRSGLIFCVAAFLFAGCSGVGTKPGVSTPPMLMKVEAESTQHPASVVWNNTALFGPVPKELQVRGDQFCQRFNFSKAIGYHPKAKGVDGKVIAGGGFYCR